MALAAQDVMHRNVAVVDASATVAELERDFVEAGVSGFPVVDAGRVVGVVSRTDVLRQLGGKGGETPRLSTFYADLADFDHEAAAESFADAAARGGQPVEALRAHELMTRSVITVSPEAPIEDVARALVEHGVHRVLVTDGGTLVGIVSSLDLVRVIAEGGLASA